MAGLTRGRLAFLHARHMWTQDNFPACPVPVFPAGVMQHVSREPRVLVTKAHNDIQQPQVAQRLPSVSPPVLCPLLCPNQSKKLQQVVTERLQMVANWRCCNQARTDGDKQGISLTVSAFTAVTI